MDGSDMKRAIPRPIKILSIFLLAILTIGIGGYIAIDLRPSLGAQGADVLRKVVGDPSVAWLEGAVFQVQDTVHQWEYSLYRFAQLEHRLKNLRRPSVSLAFFASPQRHWPFAQ